MYASAADALVRLLEGSPSRITGMSHNITSLANGIKYFSVQVTAEDGVQYGISGYDTEAEELYKTAMSKFKDGEKEPLVLLAK